MRFIPIGSEFAAEVEVIELCAPPLTEAVVRSALAPPQAPDIDV